MAAPYRGGAPELPCKEEVSAWLRAHFTKPTPSRWRRWLGESESYRYEVGEPQPWEIDFFLSTKGAPFDCSNSCAWSS